MACIVSDRKTSSFAMETEVTDAGTNMRIDRVVAPIRTQVYDQLKRALSEMRFRAGQRLTERELTEMTGVSRPTIREALQQLATEGLVANIPGKGWVVASVSRDQANELYDVRSLLEGRAARRFAERATPGEKSALQAAFESMAPAFEEGADIGLMLRTKAEFYNVLFTGARNATLVALIETLHARITAMRGVSLSVPGRPKQSVDEMRDIVARIIAGDAEGAEIACQNHVHSAARTVLENWHGEDP